MSTYLFTFRAPAGYAPSPDTFDAWSAWQAGLGARLKDRGNPGFAAAAVGAGTADTTLGGYSLIRAGSLDAAVALARGCPLLAHGGAVEICELSGHDERFDNWLDAKGISVTVSSRSSDDLRRRDRAVGPVVAQQGPQDVDQAPGEGE